jgi:hypothetical protein
MAQCQVAYEKSREPGSYKFCGNVCTYFKQGIWHPMKMLKFAQAVALVASSESGQPLTEAKPACVIAAGCSMNAMS